MSKEHIVDQAIEAFKISKTIQERAAEVLQHTLDTQHRERMARIEVDRRRLEKDMRDKLVGVCWVTSDIPIEIVEEDEMTNRYGLAVIDGLTIRGYRAGHYDVHLSVALPCYHCQSEMVFLPFDSLLDLGERLRDGASEDVYCEPCYQKKEEEDILRIHERRTENQPSLEDQIMQRFMKLHQRWHYDGMV